MQAQAASPHCLDKDVLLHIHSRHGRLEAIVAPGHGGELIGLTWRETNGQRQLLYRGMDLCPRSGWEGKAPILWPATGRSFAQDPASLPDNTPPDSAFGWFWHGQRLPMPIHGFARARPWRTIETRRDQVTVELADDAVSRKLYPFGFRFTITYRIRGNRLEMIHRVQARSTNTEPMPFSLGNHITFAVDDKARLSLPAHQVLPLDRFGRPSGQPEERAAIRARPLASFGRQDALSITQGGTPVPRAQLDFGDGLRVTLRHIASRQPSGTPVQFNLWGDVDQGFFAVEPWVGRQNALVTGDGLISLAPGERFEWTVTVDVGT